MDIFKVKGSKRTSRLTYETKKDIKPKIVDHDLRLDFVRVLAPFYPWKPGGPNTC